MPAELSSRSVFRSFQLGVKNFDSKFEISGGTQSGGNLGEFGGKTIWKLSLSFRVIFRLRSAEGRC